MNIKFYLSLAVAIALFFSQTPLFAQCNDPSTSPTSFTVINNPANPSECFLQINWDVEMPELECSTGSTPAPGSTISSNRNLTIFDVTIGGTIYPLYDKAGVNCIVNNLEYGLDINSYVTTISNMNFCLAGGMSTINIHGNQTGAAPFNCSLANSDLPAPAELVYFRGEAMSKVNRLTWATSSEENVSAFVVEKSPDGKRNIESIGGESATGFSETMQYYQIEDANPQPLAYYRLNTIDFDGSNETSGWVVLQRNAIGKDKLIQVAPVPLIGNEPLQIYYQVNDTEPIVISLSDINGRSLWEERKELEAGMYHWTFDLPDFKQHLLVLRIYSREGVISQLIPKEIID